MPALGMAQETGKIVRWLKNEGEPVTKGEPLMEVETDKATVEVESPASGTLTGITAAGGDDIEVGRAIAVILSPGETAADVKTPASPRTRPAEAARPAPEAVQAPPRLAPAGRPSASPKARRLAAERGVDIANVVGTGPGGAILEEDILQSGAGKDAAVPGETALWRAMAANVSRSWRDAPHFFVLRDIDASALVAERGRLPGAITYTDLLLKAVAAALGGHPRMNGSKTEVNIGLAVAVDDGLIVPVLHGVDRLTVAEIAARRKEVVERVRAGKMRSSDLTGGTFTISNLGMYGVDAFSAILTEGQAGILAIGRIVDRVVAYEGAPAVRPMMTICLSCDHRRVDGARAAEFMQALAALLEHPQPAG